jgi:hypothetical protein
MPNYKMANSVGAWRKGDVVSAEDIESDKRLGGLERLLKLRAVEETEDEPLLNRSEGDEPNVNETKGDNVEPGSDDNVAKRAERRTEAVGAKNDGTHKGTFEPIGAPPPVKRGPGRPPGTVIKTSNPQSNPTPPK